MEYGNDWISLTNLGFPDYECHKSGVVRRHGYKKHIGYPDKKGKYFLVNMTHNKVKMPAMRIDKIILMTFQGNPPNSDSEVIHLNYNTMDSNISNLRWGTREEKVTFERVVHLPVNEQLNDWISLSTLGFPNYECHRSGLIRRVGKTKLLGYAEAKSSYPIVEVSDMNGQKKKIKINIIICTIFHGNPPKDNSEAIHIDDNPLNLNAENVRWVKSLRLSTWGVPCTP